MTDLGHLAAAHHVQVRQALALAGTGVDELHARLDGAGEHLEEGQAALLGVVQGLEVEDHGAIVLGGDLEGVTVDERHLAVVGGRGEVGGNVVHEGVHALLLHAGTGEHGDEQTVRDGLGEQTLDLLLGEGLALEVLLHELVVGLGHEFAKRLMRSLGSSAELLGDLGLGLLGAVAMTGLHADEVDDAVEILAGAPGQRDGSQAHAKAFAEHVEAHIEVGVLLVHAIDEHGAGEAQVLGGVPKLDGGGLRALGGIDHEQGGLAHTHGRVGIADEIGIAGGVEHVDARALPVDRGDGGRDRELALDLFGVVVERGLGAVVAAQAGGLAGKVEHGLRERGLAHPALAYEHHVPHIASLGCTHGTPPFPSARYSRRKCVRGALCIPARQPYGLSLPPRGDAIARPSASVGTGAAGGLRGNTSLGDRRELRLPTTRRRPPVIWAAGVAVAK